MRKLLEQFVQGLLEGLTRPTPGSLIVAVLTIALIIFGFTPQLFIRIPHEYFIARPKDNGVLASQKALKLKYYPSNQFSVTLIGASSLHEALLGDAEMSRMLSVRLDRPVTLTKLTIRGSSLLDVARFVDQLPVDYRGIVLICISTERKYPPKKSMSRFPLTSPFFNQEIKTTDLPPPPQTGVYFVDNYRFFSKRSEIFVKALLFDPIESIAHFQEGVKLSQRHEKEKKAFEKAALGLVESYQKHYVKNFGLLERIFSRLQQNDIHGVYLQPPRNLEFTQPLYESVNRGGHIETLETEIREFAVSIGIDYWNFNDKNYFQYDDFRDYSHISNPQARARYTDMLIDKLYHLIQTKFQEE